MNTKYTKLNPYFLPSNSTLIYFTASEEKGLNTVATVVYLFYCLFLIFEMGLLKPPNNTLYEASRIIVYFISTVTAVWFLQTVTANKKKVKLLKRNTAQKRSFGASLLIFSSLLTLITFGKIIFT